MEEKIKDLFKQIFFDLDLTNEQAEMLNQKEQELLKEAKKQALTIPVVTCSSREDIEHLIAWNLSKNHTERYGVIKGKYSRTYSFMHEDKNKVLDWLAENYR